LIDSLGLESNYEKYKFKDLKKYLSNDKKVSSGKLSLVLINSKGLAFKTNQFNNKSLEKSFA